MGGCRCANCAQAGVPRSDAPKPTLVDRPNAFCNYVLVSASGDAPGIVCRRGAKCGLSHFGIARTPRRPRQSQYSGRTCGPEDSASPTYRSPRAGPRSRTYELFELERGARTHRLFHALGRDRLRSLRARLYAGVGGFSAAIRTPRLARYTRDMRGVVFTGNRKLELRTFPDPTPGPGEVVIELKASGMCGSDLKFYRRSKSGGEGAVAFGFADPGEIIAGHEPCGIVAAVGAGVTEKQARIGSRVMQFHYAGCGLCAQCRSGWGQLCIEGVKTIFGVTGNGAHARYLKCPADTLVHLPDELSFETGAAISCGTGTAWAALHRLGLGGQHTIAVFGQGPVGLSATQLAAVFGARVIAIDIGRERLETARGFG